MNFTLSGSYNNTFRQEVDWSSGHASGTWHDDVGYFMQSLRDMVYGSVQFDAIAAAFSRFKIVDGEIDVSLVVSDPQFPNIGDYSLLETYFDLNTGMIFDEEVQKRYYSFDFFQDSRFLALPRDLLWCSSRVRTGSVKYKFKTGYTSIPICFGNRYRFIIPMKFAFREPPDTDFVRKDLLGSYQMAWVVRWQFQCIGDQPSVVARGVRSCMLKSN